MIADAAVPVAERRVGGVVAALAIAVALASIAARNGGYFPTSWGWSALVFAWCAVLTVVAAREVQLSSYTVAFGAGLTAFAGWTFLSALWSDSVPATVLEGERALVYVTAIAALLLVAQRVGATVILAAVLTGGTAICAYSLATRLFPERLGTYDPVAVNRLQAPVGYWNGLGVFAALSALLALGFVARARSAAARAAAAASLVVLMPTIYFTFSRGSWLALAIGVVALLALDPRRLQVAASLLVVAPAPFIAVAVASRSSALTSQRLRLAAGSHDGHRLAVLVAVLIVVNAALGALLTTVGRRWSPAPAVRRAFAAVLVAALVAAVGAAVVTWGSPWHIAARGWHSFTAAPTAAVSGEHVRPGASLNGRLFQLSNNGRIIQWHAALHEFRHAPLVGTGAGTFDEWWQAHRPRAMQIRDAHSLYLETLGELGIVGLLLLAALLLVPLAAAWRRRAEPLIPFAAAALIAWIVHAGVDWDWEIPAVTLPALACAVVCTTGAGRRVELGRTALGVVAASAVAVACFAFVAAVGNQAAASADTALGQQNYGKAEQQASRAARWAPWSSEPWIVRGQLDARNQDPAAARKSFETAIAKDPRNYLAWYGLAGVERGAARRAAVAEVVRLNPLSDEAKELSAAP